ncbi:HET-domain-containing protein, partial [Lizonia empirigonia]
LPTRLLVVGLPGQQNIQLVHSKDLPNIGILDYVTLSYCWGKANDAACTTQQNLDERLHTITVSLLPRTIQDAITITRAVGVRYLWVDALCIIQDKGEKNEDWIREFPSVGKVYRHSLFTIAASGAKSSSDGCFYRREAALWPVQNYQLIDKNRAPGPRNPLPFKATPPEWRASVEHSALEKRGWALQERMLSLRTLFCTDNGFFWCCKELAASEFKAKIRLSECKPYDERTWMRIVQWYSGKALTVATDRLPAIQGVGSEFARLSGRKYEMGMFKDNVVKELAWQAVYMSYMGREQPLVDPQPNRLPGTPSWSWAS